MYPTNLQLDIVSSHTQTNALGESKVVVSANLVGEMGEYYGTLQAMDVRLAEEFVRRYNTFDEGRLNLRQLPPEALDVPTSDTPEGQA